VEFKVPLSPFLFLPLPGELIGVPDELERWELQPNQKTQQRNPRGYRYDISRFA